VVRGDIVGRCSFDVVVIVGGLGLDDILVMSPSWGELPVEGSSTLVSPEAMVKEVGRLLQTSHLCPQKPTPLFAPVYRGGIWVFDQLVPAVE
jgi:hypothetical protein